MMNDTRTADNLLLVFDERRAAARGDAGSATAEPAGDAGVCARLVRRAQAGDRDAFARLYELYGAMVHGVLLARVPCAEVDDLVQEVFLQAFRRLGDLRDPRTFGGWLATIARNRASDFHRRQRRTEELTEEHAARGDARRADALEALRFVRMLPEAYRETVTLRLVEGMSGAEIAARAGLTPASVRVNLHRGMKMLREMIEQRGRDAGAEAR